ncbi:CpaF family protein [Ammonifex thiophilus]|uniref:CpaF family protein n=1 Tax=Ammonifex thiophilus TaxID=444093 RepID=A0A3D8P1Q8_9THEO|nr:ATPase, T2SS/T4P/T4SS family [Ammonifex thiophilus]RDV81779.1 CpaF family protein [Ammonifex thiophilus]
MRADVLDEIRTEVFRRVAQQDPFLLRELDRRKDEVRRLVRAVVPVFAPWAGPEEAEQLADEVARDPFGWGPLLELVESPDVTNIWISPGRVLYEGAGGRRYWPRPLGSEVQVRRLAERIALGAGRRADEANPAVDCRLPDGSRVSIVLSPSPSVRGTFIVVRRFPRPYTLEDLAERGMFPPSLVPFLKLAVKARLNIVVAGAMGSGKNTLLNALLLNVGPHEVVVMVEDPAESWVGLPDPSRPDLPQPFVQVFEPRPPNPDGRGEVPMEVLFRRALRQQPDRIVCSEIRCWLTAHYVLEAMSLGHPGSASTIHADGPEEVPQRMIDLLKMHPGGAYRDDRACLARVSYVELVLFLTAYQRDDGSPRFRRLTDVAELRRAGDGSVRVVPLMTFDFRGYAADGSPLGELRPTGERPEFLKKRKVRQFLAPEELLTLEGFFSPNTC